MNILVNYFRLNKYYLFLAIVIANMMIIWLSKSALINEIVFYNTFSEQMSYDRSMEIFDGLKRYSWISYAAIPIVLLIKFTLISIVIYTGIFLFDLHERISFKKVFGVVVASEIVFITASLIKFLWFSFFAGNYDLNDMSFFYPLSLSNLFSRSEVDKMWIFPLQVLNLFQLLYILSISHGLYTQSGIQKTKVEKAVMMAYLPGLILWIALIMFLSIGSGGSILFLMPSSPAISRAANAR
jgi:hypothetical protein